MSQGRSVPRELFYTEDHEWVRVEGDLAVVGVTDHAQRALGEITYVEAPPVGQRVQKGDELAAVESAKAAADVFAPVSGTVAEVNAALEDAPEKVNEDPYGEGWICTIEGVSPAQLEDLLTPEQYGRLMEKETE